MPASRRKNHALTHSPAIEHVAVFSGPNALDPALMTSDERLAEIAAILARGAERVLVATASDRREPRPPRQRKPIATRL